jgi:iron complex outermembrane receptor protein
MRVAPWLLALAAAGAAAPALAEHTTIADEIIVTTSREGVLKAETPASVTAVSAETLDKVLPSHPAEIMNRIPGISVQQTNGEGHVTGIRQPIGTNPVYLYLEDGVPVRASGFFNHNAMYEVNLPQSGGVEVIRGPGTALHGSDAIGGVINVLTRAPSDEAEFSGLLEVGSDTWLRGLFSASGTKGDFGGRVDLNVTHSDGWRDASGYDRQSITLRGDWQRSETSRLKAVLAASNIDQDTGASSYISEADYFNHPTRNYIPIAYRKVKTVRGSLDWEQELGDDALLSVTPFMRWSEMELLPTFTLAFDPQVYTSGYWSVGTLVKYRQDFAPWRTRLITGVDLDYSPGFREEDRIWAVQEGTDSVAYTNQGRLYDYDVDFWQSSPYLQVETSPLEPLRIIAGVRYDVMGFRYDNKLADGAFITQTRPGGPDRTFYRPADDSVRYDRLSPSLGLTWGFSAYLNGFVSYKQSFRVPQESQLFRQGANGSALDLKPVKADSLEVGLRGGGGTSFAWEISVYDMKKEDDILSFNDGGSQPALTNNGETSHKGLEVGLAWTINPEWRFDISGSIADHEYKNWETVAGGTDFSGNEIASAPETVANATLGYAPAWAPGLTVEAEWVHLGAYWMDDENTIEYDGHDLANLRVNYDWRENTTVFVRITNLFDDRWAALTRVQVVGGERVAQYAPGLPRNIYAGISQRF